MSCILKQNLNLSFTYNIQIVFTKFRAPEYYRDLPPRNYVTGKLLCIFAYRVKVVCVNEFVVIKG